MRSFWIVWEEMAPWQVSSQEIWNTGNRRGTATDLGKPQPNVGEAKSCHPELYWGATI